jgi:hypothetical protein
MRKSDAFARLRERQPRVLAIGTSAGNAGAGGGAGAVADAMKGSMKQPQASSLSKQKAAAKDVAA